MPDLSAARPKVFISYSHKDEDWKNKLLDHLSIVAREEDFEVWQDRKIEPGSEWHEEILRQIEDAGIAILLVSVDFLKSDFIRNEEVRRFLDRREKGGLRIYPVIVHECPWKRVSWLSRLQVRPVDGQALSQWEGHRLNSELTKITEEIAQILETAPAPARLSRKEQFLAAFRKRLAPEYSRWDLGTVGVTQSGGAGRPIEADLDVMYLPLRLAEGFDISKTDRGKTISPKEILERDEPLVIRGPAGSGKTTWMRWTFRRLLETESALPLMLILRDLASRWQDRTREGSEKALDTFLESWVAEYVPRWEGVLPELLAAKDGPRPVLLVDGWDELGPLGDKLRSKLLGFLSQYPRVLVIVTSRPYGEGRPSHADRFEVLDIQPLADSEVSEFTTRFFIHCHGGEEKAVQRNAEHFQRALEKSPDAQALARTALLLTMMLLISRSRPLPDKRHLLYEACIENLLTALPKRKEQEGALLGREQWRPDDSEERMRVVAALAAGLQEMGYKQDWHRDPIVRSWDEMAALLPAHWPEKEKLGFLAWLTGPAGLLTDRTDGKLSFTHLSFQEYLTAWRLNATVEGPQREEVFARFLRTEPWWETLRLWAALIEKQSRERLDPVLTNLIDAGGKATMLAGTIFADGLGTEGRFKHWIDKFLQTLSAKWAQGGDICAGAWSSSRQESRKEMLAQRLAAKASSQNWLSWLRYDNFSRTATLPVSIPLPMEVPDRILVGQLSGAATMDAAETGFGRILASSSPIWPVEPLVTGLLQVWPSSRRLTALRLQIAAICGGVRSDLTQLASLLILGQESNEVKEHWSLYWARYLAQYWTRYWDRDLAQDWSRDLSRHWSHLQHHWPREWNRRWVRLWAPYLDRYWARMWPRGWNCTLAREFTYEWASNLDRDWDWPVTQSWLTLWGLNTQNSWAEEFALIDLASWAQAGARASLAYAETSEENPEIVLLSSACQLSLHPQVDSDQFDDSLAQLTPILDPLWPALARHLARRSTPEDRALLTDLAQHPEKREPPLSWGLQFIVRGDVMLRDGSVVTLDELADEAGLPHLPYLEDMPDELEVDWDK